MAGHFGGTDGKFHGFVWKNGTATDLGPDTYIRDIISYGQVVGFRIVGGLQQGFLWTPTTANGSAGVFTDLSPLKDASAINDRGQIVNGSKLWSPDAPNSPTGSSVTLPVPNGFDSVTARGISNTGHVVGNLIASQAQDQRGFL